MYMCHLLSELSRFRIQFSELISCGECQEHVSLLKFDTSSFPCELEMENMMGWKKCHLV